MKRGKRGEKKREGEKKKNSKERESREERQRAVLVSYLDCFHLFCKLYQDWFVRGSIGVFCRTCVCYL